MKDLRKAFVARLPLKPEPLGQCFRCGVAIGFILALAFIFLTAAGTRTQNPVAVIGSLFDAGVPMDPRIARLDPAVRRSMLCVALNVMMEARGEPEAGQVAVAWVTRTRSKQRDLSPCDTVFERMGGAQFSWTVNSPRYIAEVVRRDPGSFLDAQDVAWSVLVQDVRDPSGGANHFYGHRAMKPPAWTRRAVPGSKVVIGRHTFLRLPA
jgi:hypothetical protein